MIIKCIFPLIILLLLNSCSSPLSEPVVFFQVQTPRPFGYVIGDEINQRIIVEVRKGLVLQYNSIPGKGPINRWLNLNKVKINKTQGKDGQRYQIDLSYQIFYAPLAVKMLDLPGYTLQFRQFGNLIEQTVPAWYFTAAPLRELAIRKDNGIEYVRPNEAAPRIDNTAVVMRLLFCLLFAVAMGGYLAWIYGLWSFLPRYQIFKTPARQIARLSDNELESMLDIFHRALNQLNGKPLFKHHFSDFYQRFPCYQQLDTELDWFFDRSNQHFFSSDSTSGYHKDAEKIRTLCQHCLEIERGKR